VITEISDIIGRQVYTNHGIFLGNVNNLVIDVDKGEIDGIFVASTNSMLVEGGKAVNVPYRWIQSVGDIVLLRHFPRRVSLKRSGPSIPAFVPHAAATAEAGVK